MTSTTTDRRLGTNSGVAVKVPCKAHTTSNITLSGEQTIDGVSIVTDDRVLVSGQTSSVNNGIYIADTGAWARAKDFDGTYDIVSGTLIRVNQGTSNSGFWYVSTSDPITIGSSSLTFTRASSVLAEVSAFMQTVLDDTSAAAARTTLGAVGLTANTFTDTQTLSGCVINEAKGSAVASAATPDIWATTGNLVHITGTTTITGFAAAPQAGCRRRLIFDGAVTITDGANLVVPGGSYTTAADDIVDVYADTTTKFYVTIFKADGTAVVASSLPQNYMTGLGWSVAADADHDVTIATGTARDSTNAATITLSSSITKQFDATFAAGTNAGGMVSGESLPTSGTVHIWLIAKADGTTDVCGNNHATSGLSPTLPTGYVYKRRIASRRTDGSANFIPADQEGFRVRYRAIQADFSTTASTTSALVTLTVPIGFKVRAFGNAGIERNAAGAQATYFSDPSATDETASASTNGRCTVSVTAAETADQPLFSYVEVLTDTSGRIRHVESSIDASASVCFGLMGYYDYLDTK